MEDEVDDKVLYQTYVSHTKIMSRIVWSLPLNISPLAFTAYLWKLLRMYVLKPELVVFSAVLLFMFWYLQTIDLWSRNVLGKIQSSFNRGTRIRSQTLSIFNSADLERASWELKIGAMAAYAIQGRRPKMEDRFVINDNINNTGVALFAVFDGHGGEFAANFAQDKLIKSLYKKIVDVKDCKGQAPKTKANQSSPPNSQTKDQDEDKPSETTLNRKKSLKKTSTTDECTKTKEITDKELLGKLDNLIRPITREVRPSKPEIFKEIPLNEYYDKMGNVDFGKIITDEILTADRQLIEAAKKNMDVAGTTALIATLEGTKLVVANVGDSRGVMCDSKGNAIPLSFDHKPQQMREKKRIKEAGGFVTFNGVWRVAGILATSRAMGDYPLKDRKLVIADPDILSFDLKDHKPLFLILASDGLWDTFTNEEAVAFIKDRLNEPDYGAKSITLQAYYRGSLDNITVIIINFRDNKFVFNSV